MKSKEKRTWGGDNAHANLCSNSNKKRKKKINPSSNN